MFQIFFYHFILFNNFLKRINTFSDSSLFGHLFLSLVIIEVKIKYRIQLLTQIVFVPYFYIYKKTNNVTSNYNVLNIWFYCVHLFKEDISNMYQ